MIARRPQDVSVSFHAVCYPHNQVIFTSIEGQRRGRRRARRFTPPGAVSRVDMSKPTISNEVLDKLADPTLLHEDCWIGGKRVSSSDTFEVINPANGQVIATLSSAGESETRLAIDAAKSAFPEWSNMTAKERAVILRRWRELILENTDDLATICTMEAGKPLSSSRGEVSAGTDSIAWMAEECQRTAGEVFETPSRNKHMMTIKQPIGVVGAITPWNFPLNMVARKMAPTFAAGCTAVLKPAELTPLSAIALCELAKRAGLPDGVFNLVFGDYRAIGREMLSNKAVKKITFTGSTAVGKYLASQAGQTVKAISLELGGNGPFIVFEDADLEQAAKDAVGSALRNAGQACSRTNRVLVQESIYDEFVEAVTARVNEMKVGIGFDPASDMGPLITPQALKKVEAHSEDALAKGGEVTTGGKRPSSEELKDGNFFEPTVIRNATPNMLCFQEETFGPFIPIFRFKTEEEGLAMANDTDYGLSSYFYTRDVSRAFRVSQKLDFGIVAVNEVAFHHAGAPFGGWKESGIGREQGRDGLDAFLETKHICIGI